MRPKIADLSPGLDSVYDAAKCSVKTFADDAVLVREASIIAGMRMLLDHAGLVAEPSAALGIAAILEDRDRFSGRHVVTIVCGSNVDVDAYHRWVGPAPIHRS